MNRRVRFATLCAVAVMLAACGDPTPVDHNAPVASVPVGVLGGDTSELGELGAADGDRVLQLDGANFAWLVSLPHAEFEPVMLAAPGNGLSGADAMQTVDLVALVGSGFVTERMSLEPVGLLQLDGRTLNPMLQHGYTRILGITDANMLGVVHRDAYQRTLFHGALQAGPGVVEDGALDISERDLDRPKYFRAFVALCEDRTLIGASLIPTNLRTLGARLLEYFDANALACDEVVNLAGDREALLMRRGAAGDVRYQGDPSTHKVALLAFRRRSS